MSAVAGAAELTAETVVGAVEGRSPRQIFWMRFRQDKAAIGGAVVIVILLLLGRLRRRHLERRRAPAQRRCTST